MGLDVYVGSLTRYMTGDWETVVQRWARESGRDMQVIRSTPEPEDAVTDPVVVGEAVAMWRDAIAAGTGVPLEWDEDAQAPYFTDKPDWDGYASLQLLAARLEAGDPARPAQRVTDWAEDPVWQIWSRKPESRYSHLYLPELWLPADLPVIRTTAPWGQEITIGSSQMLARALDDVNHSSFEVRPGGRSTLAPSDGAYDDAARFGLAVFLDLARASVEHRLPLKLDY